MIRLVKDFNTSIVGTVHDLEFVIKKSAVDKIGFEKLSNE